MTLPGLPFDPAKPEEFWPAVQALPGFPAEDFGVVRQMLFAADGLERRPEVLHTAGARRGEPPLIVMDRTPMHRDGADLKTELVRILRRGGWDPQPAWMEPDASGQVHTEMTRIRGLVSGIRPGMSVVAVGSGTVTDLAKHACHRVEQERGERPVFVAFPTANSVNAYTSNMAPVFVHGLKRTLPSRYPDALIWDLPTLAGAPAGMTAAGVGDLLAASVSLADWRLANLLGMDPGYSDLPVSLTGSVDQILADQAEAIGRNDPDAVGLLARLIALSGFGMSFVRASTPASGFEHVIAHALDLQGERAGRPLAPHGQQIGLAAVLASAAYQIFLERFDPARLDRSACFPSEAEMRPRVEAAFRPLDGTGAVGDECWKDYADKLARWRGQAAALGRFLEDWPAYHLEIESLTCAPARLLDILRRVGAPLRFEDLTPPIPRPWVRFAFLHAPFTRRRLTLGDALVFFGFDQEKMWRRVWDRFLGLTA